MKISPIIKQSVAWLMRWRLLLWALRWAVRLFAPTHRIGVSVIVMDKANRVLLLRHVFHPTSPWGPPGGWLDRGEDPKVGAKRELFEETGLTAEVGPLIYMRREKIPDHLGLAFLTNSPEKVDVESLKLSGEILEAAWFHANHLPPRITSFVRESVQAALAKEPLIETNPS